MNLLPDLSPLQDAVRLDAPCGDDLEYSPDYAALLAAAQGKAEQQVGDLIVPASGPDWPAVVAQAVSLLGRSHDLRIAARLTQALLQSHGLPGLAAGLALVRGWLEAQWDDLYPRLDPEDNFDPAIRINALALLVHPGAVLHPLRTLPLVAGRISLQAMAQAQGWEAASDATLPDAAEIDAVFEALPLTELLDLVMATQQAADEAQAIESELALRVGALAALDFAPLRKMLGEIDSIGARWLDRRTEAPADEAADTPAPAPVDEPASSWNSLTDAPMAPPSTPSIPLGTVRNRQDALAALAAVTQWFLDHEPGHPVPILLERAQRWIGMDYLALLQDIAPEAAEQALRLRGTAS